MKTTPEDVVKSSILGRYSGRRCAAMKTTPEDVVKTLTYLAQSGKMARLQ